jgi:hypothetical protein
MPEAPTHSHAETILGDIVQMLDRTDILEDSREVVPIEHDGAAAIVWIADRRYLLTLIPDDETLARVAR